MTSKVAVANPVVELDGDEWTRSVWKMVKEQLILPYVDVPIKYYDLALENRVATEDQVTVDAAKAINECGVGIKCATCDIPQDMVDSGKLKKIWKSATVFDRERNLRSAASTLRAQLSGANFRTPVLLTNFPRLISGWTKPIIVARHVFGDQYRCTDLPADKDTKYGITLSSGGGSKTYDVHDFKESGGVVMAMYNSIDRIQGFADACFQHALEIKMPLYFSTKATLLKDYDGAFVKIFQETYDKQYADKFQKQGIWYQHMPIDDMVAFALRSTGGFVWACKNYDGDVQSQMVAQGFGSEELLSSVLLSPDGKVLTAESHLPASTDSAQVSQGKPAINPVSSIYAWINGLGHRAKLDNNYKLKDFAAKLEAATKETIEKGCVTKDLVSSAVHTGGEQKFLNSEDLIKEIAATMKDHEARGARIMYTHTDEAPMLATYAFLPIVQSFTKKSGIDIELKDISVAGRVIAAFPDKLTDAQKQGDGLAELGALAKTPVANIVKLPNVSASVPQLKACIAELQAQGFNIPNYPEDPQSAEDKEVKAKYATILGSAVNPVLREGNSDRRAAGPVKEYAKKHPHSMGKWATTSKTHVAHMSDGDFFGSEKSWVADIACDVRIEHIADADGSATVLKPKTALLPGEVIDASRMSAKALREFYEKEIEDSLKQDVLFSLHLKATMMKVSDPIMFGHCVTVFFKDVFEKHAETFKQIGVNPNNGLGDVYAKIKDLDAGKRKQIEDDLAAVYKNRPEIAMVDSDKGITNLHVPSDVIIDASMPAMIRSSGQMWTPGNKLKDCKAVIPDRSYAGVFKVAVDDCRKNGAFNPSTMGTVPNVGLMAQKAEEYGSHDKTFEIKSNGTVRVVQVTSGQVLLEHKVETGDIWRMCQTKDVPIQDWVKLAVTRARATGAKAIFWLDPKRGHDAVMIEKVKTYLKQHDTTGLDIDIMPPVEACQLSCTRARQGLDTISATGNVLRDYNTDLFPILELGTSAKMLSIVPLLAGGGMYETGAGGSAPKHVQQFVEQNHLRWDSLGEYLALAVSIEDLANMTKNPKAKVLATALDAATTQFLDSNKSPSRKCGELDNRGSHFYLGLYWARALAEQNDDLDLKAQFKRVADELNANESLIVQELIDCQGKPVDIGGYYHPDPEKCHKAMCPSATFNAILTLGANWGPPVKKS